MSEQVVQQSRPEGRPTLMTPGTVDKLAAAFQRGFSVTTACKIARIDRTTYYKWMKESPEIIDRMEGAQEYAKILAGDTIIDVLQDVHRGKKDPITGVMVPKKYSEQTVVNTSKWFVEKTEREIFGSQSMIAAKTEINDKGGTTTTIVYATDDILRQFHDQEEILTGQLLEALEDTLPGEEVTGGGSEGSTPPVHPEEFQGEHTPEESVPEP
jgi:hypothetical protein